MPRKRVKPTLREGERNNTSIPETTKFMLGFPEVFQQIVTGIVALSMYHNVYATNRKMSVNSFKTCNTALVPAYMEQSFLGKKGHPSSRINFSERLYKEKEKSTLLPKLRADKSARAFSLGNFRIVDGDYSENVTFELNSRFFELSCVYSKSVKMSNVGEISWGPHSSLEREKKIRCRLFTSSINGKLGIFTSESCSDRNEMHNLKKRDARAKLFFCLINLLLFCRSQGLFTWREEDPRGRIILAPYVFSLHAKGCTCPQRQDLPR